MTELNKKFELVAGVSDLSESEFLIDTGAKAQSEIDNSTIVPGLDPDAASTKTLIGQMVGMIVERKAVIQTAKQLTKDIKEKRKQITSVVSDLWPPQIKAAIGNDAGKANLLNYKVKWLDGGHSPDEPSIKNSNPLISDIESHGHLEEKIRVINSKSGRIGLPWDVEHTNLYEYFGATAPTSTKQCRYLGVMKRGVFINHHDPLDIDKDVWYLAEYIPKNEGDSSELSGAVKSKVQ